MRKFLSKTMLALMLAGTLSVPQPAVAKPAFPPRHYSPYGYHRYYPAGDYHYSGRLCTRSVRRWVPTRYYYDDYGHVERVRGKTIRVRVRVPC